MIDDIIQTLLLSLRATATLSYMMFGHASKSQTHVQVSTELICVYSDRFSARADKSQRRTGHECLEALSAHDACLPAPAN